MKKKNEEKLKELCGAILGEAMEKIQDLTDDPSYSGYLVFTTIGSIIAENEGIERLDEYVREIKERV